MATLLQKLRDGVTDTALVGGSTALDGSRVEIVGVFDDASGNVGRVTLITGDASLSDAAVGDDLVFSVTTPGVYSLNVDLQFNLGPGRQGSYVGKGIFVGGIPMDNETRVLPPGEQFPAASMSAVFDASQGLVSCGVNLAADGNPVGTDSCIFRATLVRLAR